MISPARASTNLPHQGLAVQCKGSVTHHPGLGCYQSTRFVPFARPNKCLQRPGAHSSDLRSRGPASMFRLRMARPLASVRAPAAEAQALDRTQEGSLAQGNTGTCELCKERVAKAQMTRHLAGCAASHDVPGAVTTLVQLRVEAAGDPRYWLHIEGRAEASMKALDALLRRVWLECCGHMSAFRVGEREVAMGSKLGFVVGRAGQRFSYDYDFGSTTALRGQVLGVREGSIGRTAVRLLARNDPLQWQCDTCSAPATVVCPFCLHSGPCLFCDDHAGEHPCAEEDVYLPVVNSPRMGVCGYGA